MTQIPIVDYPEGLVPRYMPNVRFVNEGDDLQAAIDSARGPSLGYTSIDFSGVVFVNTGEYITITYHPASGAARTHTFEYDSSTIAGATKITANSAPDDIVAAIAAHESGLVVSDPLYAAQTLVCVDGWVEAFVPEAQADGWPLVMAGDYHSDDSEDLLFILTPGTYQGPIKLYNRTHITGTDRDSCIVLTEDIVGGKGIILGSRHSSVSNISVESADTSKATQTGVEYRTAVSSYKANVDNVRFSLNGWGVAGGAGIIDQCVLQHLSGEVAQPFFHKGKKIVDSIFRDIVGVCPSTWTPGTCQGLSDQSDSVRCLYDNIVFRGYSTLEPSNHAYGLKIKGNGNIINNIAVQSNDSATFPAMVIDSRAVDGETSLPNIIDGYAVTSTGTTVAITLQTIGVVPVHIKNMDVYCADTNSTLSLDIGVGGNVLLMDNALRANVLPTLAGAIPIGWPIGTSGAITATSLDTAFCGTGNRPLLAGWFRGKYTVGATVYNCWTDGTNWYYASQTAAS